MWNIIAPKEEKKNSSHNTDHKDLRFRGKNVKEFFGEFFWVALISELSHKVWLKKLKQLWKMISFSGFASYKVVFSEESNFMLFPPPCLMIRWRPEEAYEPQHLTPTVKFGAGWWWSCVLQQGWNRTVICLWWTSEAK